MRQYALHFVVVCLISHGVFAEQLTEMRSEESVKAHTVRLSVSQTFAKSETEAVIPYEDLVHEMLSFAGPVIVDSSAEDYFVEIQISSVGKALSREYSPGGYGKGTKGFNGASVSGTISVTPRNSSRYILDFSGKYFPPSSVSHIIRDPSYAPFENALSLKGSFVSKFLVVVGDIFGVDPLVKVIEDSSSNFRINAAEALGETGDLGAVNALRHQINQDLGQVDYDFWTTAGNSLNNLAWVPVDDREKTISLYCEGSWAELKSLGDEAVAVLMQALLRAKKIGPKVTAAKILGEMKAKQAVHPLVSFLAPPHHFLVREAACSALGEIGDPRAIEPLIIRLSSFGRGGGQQARKALTQITGEDFGRNPPKWRAWWEENRSSFLVVPLQSDAEPVDLDLAKIIENSKTMKLNVAQDYTTDQGEEIRVDLPFLSITRDVFADCFDIILKDENQESDITIEIASTGMSLSKRYGNIGQRLYTGASLSGTISFTTDRLLQPAPVHFSCQESPPNYIKVPFWGGKYAGPTGAPFRSVFACSFVRTLSEFIVDICSGRCLECLHASKYPSVRKRALTIMDKGENADGARVLVAASNDPDQEVRATAVQYLGEYGGAEQRGSVIDALSDTDDNVRIAALDAIGQLCDSATQCETLIDALDDSHERVRRVAIQSIGEPCEGSSAAAEALVPLIMPGVDVFPKEKVMDALSAIGSASVDALVPYLNDEDTWVRIKVCEALGKIGNSGATPGLMVLLGDYEALVRRESAEALGYIRDNRAVPMLIAALKDPDFGVRDMAAWSLGSIKDIRAVPPLIDALDTMPEWAAHALEDITGKKYGENKKKWLKWWEKHGGS